MGRRKPSLRVWFVDDLESRRNDFKERHGKDFDLTLFETPDEVLRALDEQSPPDALLCDIYFLGRGRHQIEDNVETIARQSKELAQQYDVENHQAGIDLIENLRHRYKGFRQFPIYAHTSKGPYLIQGRGFERLSNAGALWLFKDRCSPAVERQIIYKDIMEFRERFGLIARSKYYFGLFVSALFGAILGGIVSHLIDSWWPR